MQGQPRLARLCVLSSLYGLRVEGLRVMPGSGAVPGDRQSSSAGGTGPPGLSQARAPQVPLQTFLASGSLQIPRGPILFSFRKVESLSMCLKWDFHV